MRIGEAMTLTLDKLHLDERHIVVGLEGKGRAERLVPIGDPTKRDGGHLLHALRAWLRARPASPTTRLFVDRRGFAISAKGATREEALTKLRAKIQTRLKNGTEVVGLEVGSSHPWMEFAGMFKDDPHVEDWIESMAEYRRQVEDDPKR